MHRYIGLLFTVSLAGATLVASSPAWSQPAHQSPGTSERAATMSQPAPRAHQVHCVDIPMSSALIAPRSCWQLSPTMMAVAGSSPTDPNSGAVAVLNGQGQGLQITPGSGPLRIIGINATTACTAAGNATYRDLNLATAKLGAPTHNGCAAGPFNQPPTPSTLLADPLSTSSTTSLLASSLPPPTSPSYYEYQSYVSYCSSTATSSCPLYQQGQATYPPEPAGVVILDFGAPCFPPNDTSVYGTQMFGNNVCTPDTTIGQLVDRWIAGYESDHGAGTTPITIAVGTSNSLNCVDGNCASSLSNPPYALSNTQMSASGKDWYSQIVGSVGTSTLTAPVTLWGASDMEQSGSGWWYAGTPTVTWVQGYASASPARYTCSQGQTGFLADYGDNVLGASGSAYGWTVSQVYQVAWSIPVACAIPEIYYSGMASEWEALSQWGFQNSPDGYINFTGVMTEAVSGSYTPTQGWEQLQQATGQSPQIPTVTNIGSSLQGQPPSVSAVAPNQGPIAGGTVVTISGANFLGTQAVYFGANAAPSFTVVSSDRVTATAPAGTPGFTNVVVETNLGASPAVGTDGLVYQDTATYHPLVPARIEDTRSGSGLPGSGHPPGPAGVINIQVTGAGGVPTTGVAAVVINLTITNPTAGGYVTAYPTGTTVPLVSTIDFRTASTKANLALVTLGRNGQISIFNATGTTQVVIDVEGWYSFSGQATNGSLLNPLYPKRIVDTRPNSGLPYSGDTLGPGQSLTVQVAGVGGVPPSGATAVVMNLTETDATASSYLTAYPAGATQPLSSNLNFAAGQTVANQLMMELGSGGKVTIYNDQGSVNVILDVAGWLGSSGAALNTVVPARAVDTRPNSGEPYAGHTLAPKQELTVNFAGLAGLPSSGIGAIAINVTVTDTAAPGVLLVGPGGQPIPGTSEVNWAPGQTTENLVVMAVGSDGSMNFYNDSSGSVDIVIDAYGWFA